jgi:hypothetical protein
MGQMYFLGDLHRSYAPWRLLVEPDKNCARVDLVASAPLGVQYDWARSPRAAQNLLLHFGGLCA